MADVGLTDTLGINEGLKDMFMKHAEFDENGVLSKLNVDKWDKDIRDDMSYAIIRDEAQQIQQTNIGELPPWMNKPINHFLFGRHFTVISDCKPLETIFKEQYSIMERRIQEIIKVMPQPDGKTLATIATKKQ